MFLEFKKCGIQDTVKGLALAKSSRRAKKE
jgi:hypothetical protein